MNRLLFTTIICLIITGTYAQKILVIENRITLKNIKYYQGDKILVRLAGNKDKIADRIFDLTDSTVIFEIYGEFGFDEVACIYRENWLVQTARGLTLLGGIGYFAVDSFNRMINHEYPVIDSGTLIISGGMVAVSFALTPFRYRKIETGEKWQLKAIDMGSFD
jgi:hypothetical protein